MRNVLITQTRLEYFDKWCGLECMALDYDCNYCEGFKRELNFDFDADDEDAVPEDYKLSSRLLRCRDCLKTCGNDGWTAEEEEAFDKENS